MKKALISGITGQDGSYLAELLLGKGYAVHGIVRRVALEDPEHRLWRLKGIKDNVHLHAASLESYASIFRVVQRIQPDECYHLAAQSFVSYSFDDEFSTIGTNINGTHFILSSIKEVASDCKFYFAGSSEMFGNAGEAPQDEDTPFQPRSPYGISKVAAFHLTKNYREAYGLFACNGICFNHESERRGFEFVTRKVTNAAARIQMGLVNELRLGNLDAARDWGYAPDYVQAMWAMLQQPEPSDFVVATGIAHTVRQLLEVAFGSVDLNWQDFVTIDQALYRPAEIQQLRGDARKAKKTLGWEPRVSFDEMIRRMVRSDLDRLAGARTNGSTENNREFQAVHALSDR